MIAERKRFSFFSQNKLHDLLSKEENPAAEYSKIIKYLQTKFKWTKKVFCYYRRRVKPCVMPLGVAAASHNVVVASVALRCAVRSGSARLRLRWSDVVGVGPQAWRLPCGKMKTLKKGSLKVWKGGCEARGPLKKSTKLRRGSLACLPGPQHPHSPAPA